MTRRRNGIIWTITMTISILLIGGGILWWWRRSHPRRIVLSDLPPSRSRAPRQYTDRSRHNGRPLEVEIASGQ